MIIFMTNSAQETSLPSDTGWYSTAAWMYSIPDFARQVKLIENMPYEPLKPYPVREQLRYLLRILRIAQSARLLHLFSTVGSLKPELLAAALLAILPGAARPAIVIQGPMWEPDGGIKGFGERLLLKILAHSVDRFAVYSHEEISVFAATWNIDPQKVDCIPYCFDPDQAKLPATPARQDVYVFAGGNSHRNYLPLVEAARLLPEVRFIIATHRLSGITNIPANVTASSLPHDVYTKTMQNAAVNIVPIQGNLHRSVGHQTFLNSMALKIPTIVNRVLGIEEYIQHQKTGWVVEGTPESYAETIRAILQPENQAQVVAICEAAVSTVREQFSLQREAATLLEWFKKLTT